MKPAIILAAVLIGAFRPVLLFRDFNSHVEVGYQAVAHILVGMLLGAWYVLKESQDALIQGGYSQLSPMQAADKRAWLIQTFWILTAIEVICAAITIYRKFT